jgi:HD-GYP domain-containing protein (c-di-GMP phosphodiesterase class II)
MQQHPRISYEVLRPVARLEPALLGVLHHHENYDGSGYPDGLRDGEIPLAAQIIHVVDVFDALTSTRSYRKAFDVERAFEILRQESGRMTDPHVTKVFIEMFMRYARENQADLCERFAHLCGDAVHFTPDEAPSKCSASVVQQSAREQSDEG